MVDSSSLIRRGHPITFIVFTFVAFIVSVIASTLVADYNSNHNPPTQGINNATRFLVFAGWWGFVVGAAYVSISWSLATSLIDLLEQYRQSVAQLNCNAAFCALGRSILTLLFPSLYPSK